MTSNEYRALVLSSLESGFAIEKRSIPVAEPGSAVVQIMTASIFSYHREISNGERMYSFPMPIGKFVLQVDIYYSRRGRPTAR